MFDRQSACRHSFPCSIGRCCDARFVAFVVSQDELVAMMNKEGFVFTNYVNFTFGVVAVHSGFKM